MSWAEYYELPSDAAFTAFLSNLTPGRVLKDRERNFTKEERRRQKYLREKAHTEGLVANDHRFTRKQIEIALAVMNNKEKK